MSKIKYAGRCMMELLLALTISLIPVAAGLMVVLSQQEKKLADHSRASVQQAIFAVDQSLDRLHDAANNALSLAGKPCDEVLETLLKEVDTTQYLRSLALVENHHAYCITLGTLANHDAYFVEKQATVQLIFGAPSTPDRGILSYQARRDNVSAIATLYATKLRNELLAFEGELSLLLEIGDSYLWALGDSRDPQRPAQTEFFETRVSEKYGYTVKAGYAEGFGASAARQAMMKILPSLALVGIATGSIFYWAVFSVHRNRRDDAAKHA